MESTQKIRKIKKQCARNGRKVECYIGASPFGENVEGVVQDSVYHFRFVEEESDIFAPLLIVEFDPTIKELFELNFSKDTIEKLPLSINRAMISQLNEKCSN